MLSRVLFGIGEQRILDVAIDQFGVRGVDAVSLDEIARTVGVRKQTVLYWFASKDELVEAVPARRLTTLVGAAGVGASGVAGGRMTRPAMGASLGVPSAVVAST